MRWLNGWMAGAGIGCALMAGNVAAQPAWPARPLRIIVMAAPGGLPDIAARTIATHLAKPLGQPVVVENRAGGAGNIAAEHVARSAPDGYTLLLSGNNLAINRTLLPDPGFDYERDLAPVTMVGEANMVLIASPSFAANNVSELLALARAKPGGVSIATSPLGTPNHIGAELLAAMGGLELSFITYKGIGPALPDLMAGQVQLAVSSIAAALPLVKAGRLKALAVTQPKRSSLLPDVPTVAESGLPGFDVYAWVCLMATGGTPPPVIERLNTEVRAIMALAEVRDAFQKQGTEPATTTAAQLGAYIRAEAEKWAGILKNSKVKGG